MDTTVTIIMYVLAAASAIVGIITWFIDSDRLSASKKFLIFFIAVIVSFICFFATDGADVPTVDLSGCVAISDVGIFPENNSNENNGYIDDAENNADLSKEYYEVGCRYFDEGNYEYAILQFEQVEYNSHYYDLASSKLSESKSLYKDNMIDIINALIDDGRYDEALAQIDVCQTIVGDDVLLQSKTDEINTALIMLQISEYEANGDTVGAIRYIQDDLYGTYLSSEVELKLHELKSTYRESVLLQAENELNNGGYDAAISCLDNALHILGYDDQIQKAIDFYESCKPVPVSSLTVLSREDCGFGTHTDMYGNTHEQSCQFGSWFGSGTIELNLDRKYSSISGLIAPGSSWDYRDRDAVLYFYADDELIAEYSVSYNTEPYYFSISVENARLLKIICKGYHNRVNDKGTFPLIADFYVTP